MKIFANKKTKVAHSVKRGDSCKQRTLEPENIVKFETIQAAILKGYRACKRCKPE
jgi:methylphosphotriester-DNA--protein-cysteine methyltransferase